MRIVVGDGKMSRVIRRPYDVVLSHDDIELRDGVEEIVRSLRRAHDLRVLDERDVVVINTAAKINLEWCEAHPEDCYSINAWGAHKLACACDLLGFKLVQVSSGCVFDGMETGRVFAEDDEPNPACAYAASKAQADSMILNAKHTRSPLIVRPRQIVSSRPCPTNMVSKFLGLPSRARFVTTPNSITSLEEFALALEHLIDRDACGIFNVVQRGTASPFEIATALEPLSPIWWEPKPIAYADYLKTIPVKRVNALLSTDKLEATGFVPLEAKEALARCVAEYGRLVERFA